MMMDKRYLSRNVVVDGVNRGLCLVTISEGNELSVEPYEIETAGTSYLDAPIIIKCGVMISPIFNALSKNYK